MSLLDETKQLAKTYGIKPDQGHGQHFLIDSAVLDKIVAAAQIKKNETILEIGTGLGTLTAELVKQAGRVVSFETDRRLDKLLTILESKNKNLTIIRQDFLKVNFEKILATDSNFISGNYKVVANIPYYITGKIINTILDFSVLPKVIVLLVQQEVAEKIIARPGSYSKQSLGVQFYGQPFIVAAVSAASFWPVPEVASAIIQIKNLHHWQYQQNEAEVWQLIRIGFSSKRKTLVNNLSAGLQLTKIQVADWLKRAALDLKIRAEDLSLEQWLSLTDERKNGRTEERKD